MRDARGQRYAGFLGNDRLAGFLRSVGVERRFFDYPSLKLL
jgi:hypothetical protein